MFISKAFVYEKITPIEFITNAIFKLILEVFVVQPKYKNYTIVIHIYLLNIIKFFNKTVLILF